MTKTSDFGVGKREGHDARAYYARRMAGQAAAMPQDDGPPAPLGPWADQIYQASSTDMAALPARSVGFAMTSPPYNVGKEYDGDLSLAEYETLIGDVAREVWRVLVPGGRYVVNIANLGRSPYVPMTAIFHRIHAEAGFMCQGEVIWRKAKGASGNCAWGSWRSASAPRLRDVHEYLLVFCKGRFSRPDKGDTAISAEAFMESTLSIWDIQPESAKRVNHPAPFPVALAARAINLWSYVGDVVLDPFIGSGTLAVAALGLGRHYVGYDTDEGYCQTARQRIAAVRGA